MSRSNQPASSGPTPSPAATHLQVRKAIISDVVSVVVFVLLAAMAHSLTLGTIGLLLACFLPALALAWLATRAWKTNPAAIKPVGLGIWAATTTVGLAILAIVKQQRSDPIMMTITAVVLALFLVGWRALATAMEKQQRPR
ncbi:DUF3054 domain-containing protein [Rarobacter incanus]|uniref:DUF3054 family protein n=1 Tax=Rarobacter incanus TaxID=153494 RepID=A0A542SSQ2_9MICO|nr:DUF3054 domain-containing protein [Rarobacter incanus]TQK77297.1 DUF3054 family protein [Rarobacter incanus]